MHRQLYEQANLNHSLPCISHQLATAGSSGNQCAAHRSLCCWLSAAACVSSGENIPCSSLPSWQASTLQGVHYLSAIKPVNMAYLWSAAAWMALKLTGAWTPHLLCSKPIAARV